MNLAVVGTGTMGRLVCEMGAQNPSINKIWSIEPALGETLWDLDDSPDVVIDFSHPKALGMICDFATLKKGDTALVIATTGYTSREEQEIKELSRAIPIMKSSNYSYGINALRKILSPAANILNQVADVEIIEKHHNQKIDAPSGTAKLLADTIDPEYDKERIYGRCGDEKRKDEIGIHSVRGGTIFGEHTVIFAMKDEVIEIKHTAFSKAIFAKGAIEAALWMNKRDPGYYTFEDLLP